MILYEANSGVEHFLPVLIDQVLKCLLAARPEFRSIVAADKMTFVC